jgi:hypothetical protein
MLSLALVGLSGCTQKENASSNDGKKTVETKTVETKENTKKDTKANTKANDKKTSAESNNQEKLVHDLVLADTKIVQVTNINRRSHELYPDLGPFFVVRGIDVRGQKSEIWIKDMKIFEMVTQK